MGFYSVNTLLQDAQRHGSASGRIPASGALNELPEIDHRREALCQVEPPLHQEPTLARTPFP